MNIKRTINIKKAINIFKQNKIEKTSYLNTKRVLSAVVSATILTSALSLSPVVFADGSPSFWAETEVNSAIQNGYVPNTLQDNYTQDITRQNFAYLAVSFLAKVKNTTTDKLTEQYNHNPFNDTDDKYIKAAYGLKILNGRGDGTFAPNDTISRQEAAKVIVSTYYAYTGKSPNIADEYLTYNDAYEIADWAREYVSSVTSLGLMKGDHNNYFTPEAKYTTEQSIITFERLYQSIKSEEGVNPDMTHKNPQITEMLKSENGILVKENTNEAVLLNGVNLGSWLMMEMWMGPIEAPNDEFSYSDVISTLKKRFGEEKAQELINLYEESFITDEDFARIEALGFNCIRLPFWYRNFMNENGNWFTLRPDENPGFKLLDKIIDKCSEHGLYVILDMHGCPGGQSMNHSTGVSGKNQLYGNEKNLSAMESLWTTIAERYKDNPTVAAYDIMNEPMNNGGYSGLRAWQPGSDQAIRLTNGVYDRMIKAIRKTGDNHVITVEGIWSINNLPDPQSMGWNNMMYQLHLYDEKESDVDDRIRELTDIAQKQYGTAVLVGEYNNKQSERYAAGRYKENGINRVKWTYKAVNAWYDGWALYNKNIDRIDIQTATEEEIRTAFGTKMLTENNFMLDTAEYNKITLE